MNPILKAVIDGFLNVLTSHFKAHPEEINDIVTHIVTQMVEKFTAAKAQ